MTPRAKRFNRLVKLRKGEERQVAQALAQALDRLDQAASRLQQCRNRIHVAQNRFFEQSAQGVDAALQLQHFQFMEQLEQELSVRLHELAVAEQTVVGCREEMVEAARARKTVEIVLDGELEQQKREQGRREAVLADEQSHNREKR